ncbi:MAG: HAMP domain-containing histidine kinase [Acidobacteria bacterium]|nr:HAMP domain-containing histidine kinase [Acidobacteriota bacterium]
MRRSWPTYLLIGGIAIVIAALGVLQYQWQKRISVADAEKARSHVNEQTQHFAEDFNREIQNAYFNFQTDPIKWEEKDWGQFNERYNFWRQRATYPELISGFYYFEAKPDSPFLRYDAEKGEFVPSDGDADVQKVRAATADPANFRPAMPAQNSLILPVPKPEKQLGYGVVRLREPGSEIRIPERLGYLIVKLDPTVIRERILPELTAKYFPDHEFTPSVGSIDGDAIYNNAPSGPPDATAALFDLSPDNMIFYANKELMSSLEDHKTAGTVMVDSHVESKTFNRVQTTSGNSSTLKVEVKGPLPRRSVFTATTVGDAQYPWILAVQHSSGSLDGFIASTLRRNLAIGFGLLALLAAAIFAIVFSSLRSRILAQRQIDFVSSVSHEFRTPLAVIYSAGENLADGVAKDPLQVEKYGALVKGEGRKLSAMVEQVLEFAGANSGRRKFNFGNVDVEDVVDTAVSECRPQIDEKYLTVDVDLAPGLPLLRGDRPALVQAVANLLANSIKYSNGSKSVSISASNGNDTVKIAVEDSGIGISKSDLKQVFKPFYRSKDVVDAQIHGNGLGLALVKQIVDAHGGKVTAESEPGVGSKFTIELPQV